MAIAPPADTDLAQMAAVLAAEGYVWFTPIDGGPRRLVKVARPADDVRARSPAKPDPHVATLQMGRG